ncbi:N-chimaerin-like [Acropora palmata]|uniref:N-chimaerin-like n=1 Tax=Acropora palmata TaxID=6131 RepID=UPI003DA054B1
MTEVSEGAEEGRLYDTLEQPVWKSYLYRLQQKAPKARRVMCGREVSNKPSHYGREFHGCISREEADELVSESDGCYLVRESQRSPGSYTLTMRFGGVSKNFRLYYDGLHYVGEKRFQTIQDLVADGLITMYIDTYAKDYVDTMMIPPAKPEEKKSVRQSETKENQLAKELIDQADSGGQHQEHRYSIGKRPSLKPSAYKKNHNFKMNTFKGPHWCDYCRNFLWGLIMQGVKCQDCGFNAHKQCSTSGLIPPECKPDRKYVKRVFGVDLTTLVKLHNCKRPYVVEACIAEVEKRGLDSEGIYRVSGFSDDIEALKDSFDNDSDSVNLSAYDDINIVCGALKQYFRMLPIPVITFELYNKFIDAARIPDKHRKAEALSEAIDALPHSHFETLKYLLGHLYRVARRKKENMMSEQNLSIVFGPTLMRSPEGDSVDILSDMKAQRLVIETLISWQDILFESS